MAIGSSILVMGLKQYQTYKLDSDLRMVMYNVDSLFLAATLYYRANCGSQTTGAPGTAVPGALSPWRVPQPGQEVLLNIQTDLLDKGYLKAPIANNRLINSSGAGGGYTVQYNLVSFPRMINSCTGTGCTPVPTQIGTTWDWKIQVGVTLASSTIAQGAQYYLQASCLSTSKVNTGALVNCSAISAFTTSCINLRTAGGTTNNNIADSNGCPPTANPSSYSNYIIFERNPLFPMNKPEEGLWGLKATNMQNYQNQTSYPLPYLLSTSHNPEFQYFVCGT